MLLLLFAKRTPNIHKCSMITVAHNGALCAYYFRNRIVVYTSVEGAWAYSTCVIEKRTTKILIDTPSCIIVMFIL